jgi:hypothetical protein
VSELIGRYYQTGMRFAKIAPAGEHLNHIIDNTHRGITLLMRNSRDCERRRVTLKEKLN